MSFKVQLASLPDRENLVVEIFFGDNQVAEISNETNDKLRIEIYPAPKGEAWNFSLEGFLESVQRAKKRLED